MGFLEAKDLLGSGDRKRDSVYEWKSEFVGVSIMELHCDHRDGSPFRIVEDRHMYSTLRMKPLSFHYRPGVLILKYTICTPFTINVCRNK